MNASDNQIRFMRALIGRFLTEHGLDSSAAAILEAGMRTGRNKQFRPPNPGQQPEIYYPGLTARPWHDPDAFEWVSILKAGYAEIRNEAIDLFERRRFKRNPISGDLAEGSWTEVRLISEGLYDETNCAACPNTMRVVERIPGAVAAGLVYFAALEPGAHLRAHFGPHNARLRCHLGLVVPPGCALRVDNETRTWAEGEVLVFDDSFEHEVWNRGSGTRIVLIVDVWHPDLSPAQIVAIRCAASPLCVSAYEVAHGWVEAGEIK